MERSPEFFFTLDTVVGEGMPKIKDSNDRVEETGKQAKLKQVLVITVDSVPRLSRAEQENHQGSLTTITERRLRRKRENMCHTVNKGVHRGI